MDALGFDLVGDYLNVATKTAVRCKQHDETFQVYPNNILRGQRLMCCGNVGRSRYMTSRTISESTVELIRAARRGTNLTFDAVIRIALGRADVGQPGYFYIARLRDGALKFGSTIRSMPVRLPSLKFQEPGMVGVILTAQVPDARGYEAAMMERYREHWIRGERFRDFLAASA